MKITQEMLNAAMEKAVALKLLPAHADEITYLKHWEEMKLVLEAAVTEIEPPDASKNLVCGMCGHCVQCQGCGNIELK